LRQKLPADVVGVFILPPNVAALETRLRARGGDAEAEIQRRMRVARDEINHWPEFDHVVVNDDLEAATAKVRAILHAARSATRRQPGLADFVARITS
jgi:guanylate kinase